MCLFFEKGVLFDSIKGCLGVIFQTPPNMSFKKACLGVNLRAKSHEILDFPGDGKSRIGMFWKPLVTHVCNTSIWVAPWFKGTSFVWIDWKVYLQVCSTLLDSYRLLLSNQDKGCTPTCSVKILSYFIAVTLHCRTAHSYDVTALRCRMKVKFILTWNAVMLRWLVAEM